MKRKNKRDNGYLRVLKTTAAAALCVGAMVLSPMMGQTVHAESYKSGTCDDNGQITWVLWDRNDDGAYEELQIRGFGDITSHPWCYDDKDNVELVTAYVDDRVTTLPGGMFINCKALKTVHLPENSNLTEILHCTFFGCEALEEVNIPDSVEAIWDQAFSDCFALSEIKLPASLDYIGWQAFADAGLKELTIPEYVSMVCKEAFWDCKSLTKVTLSNNFVELSDGVFKGCVKLQTCNLPSSMTTMSAELFSDCKELTGIVFPSDLETIGKSALMNCKAIRSLTIPASVTSIGEKAFGYCNSLSRVQFLGGEPDYIGYNCFDNDEAIVYYPKDIWTAAKRQDYGGTMTWLETDPTKLLFPDVKSVVNEVNGIMVSWTTVEGAAKYRVLRKTSSTDWANVTDTAATTYLDNAVTSGETYYYSVACLDSAGKVVSDYDTTGAKKLFVSAPSVTKFTSLSEGLKINWAKVNGANYVSVYRKEGTGWKLLKEKVFLTTYTDTDVEEGKTYTYSLQATDSSGNALSGFDKEGKTGTYSISQPVLLDTPKLGTIQNTETGIQLTWNAVTGAESYQVFYKLDGDASWTKANLTTGTSATVTNLTLGKKYYLTVCCCNAAGTEYTSSYDTTGLSIVYLRPAPVISKYTNTTNGVTLVWNALANVPYYKVRYKVAGGSWTTAGFSAKNAFTVRGLTPGKTYYFLVSGYDSTKTTLITDYKTSSAYMYPHQAPTISRFTNTANGVTLVWNALTNVPYYKVRYKESGGSWKTAGFASNNAFTIKGLTPGKSYHFLVAGYDSTKTTLISDYKVSNAHEYLPPAPTITKFTDTSNGVTLVWNALANVPYYKVRYKEAGGSWKTAGFSSTNAFTVKSLTPGKTYYFLVSGYNSTKTTLITDYKVSNAHFYPHPAPTITKYTDTVNGVTVTWNALSNVPYYKIRYKEEGGSWKTAGFTDKNAFTIKGLTLGKTYYFLVSGYDSTKTNLITNYKTSSAHVYQLSSTLSE